MFMSTAYRSATPSSMKNLDGFRRILAPTHGHGVGDHGTIHDFRMHAARIAEDELERTLKRLSHLSPEAQKEIELFSHRLMGKILHAPTQSLQDSLKNGEGRDALSWIRKLFRL